jgi:hypothetical protein
MSGAYANLKRRREKAIAALDVANDATERATEIGERFVQAALPMLTAPIMERVNAAKSPSPCHQNTRGSLQRARATPV